MNDQRMMKNDETRINFQQCLKDINQLILKIDTDSKPDFNKWLAFEDLYCRIKRKRSQLESKPTMSVKRNDDCWQSVKIARIEIPEFDGNPKD